MRGSFKTYKLFLQQKSYNVRLLYRNTLGYFNDPEQIEPLHYFPFYKVISFCMVSGHGRM